MTNKLVRKLARSDKYQILYARAKELGNIKLFKNDIDISKLQITFLYWLEIYNSLYTDLAMNEKWINEDVIESDLRVEAYLLLRRKLREEKKEGKETDNKSTSDGGIPSVIFNRK